MLIAKPKQLPYPSRIKASFAYAKPKQLPYPSRIKDSFAHAKPKQLPYPSMIEASFAYAKPTLANGPPTLGTYLKKQPEIYRAIQSHNM